MWWHILITKDWPTAGSRLYTGPLLRIGTWMSWFGRVPGGGLHRGSIRMSFTAGLVLGVIYATLFLATLEAMDRRYHLFERLAAWIERNLPDE